LRTVLLSLAAREMIDRRGPVRIPATTCRAESLGSILDVIIDGIGDVYVDLFRRIDLQLCIARATQRTSAQRFAGYT